MKLRDDIERWLTHKSLTFTENKNDTNSFHFKIKYADEFGMQFEIFEPKRQPGVLVIGAKVTMNNNQNARYLAFSKEEKELFETKITEYCKTIRAINRNTMENGRYRIGIYVVLDKPDDINQQSVFDAMDDASKMHEKVTRFMLKTF